MILDLFNKFSSVTKIFTLTTLFLLFYGYLCRVLNIYFFWESKTLGWLLFFISSILIVFDLIRIKNIVKSNKVFAKIVIGFFVFILVIKGVLFFATPYTSAYTAAILFLKSNDEIRKSVGKVNGIFLMPFGGIGMSSGPEGESGNADLNFIIKGSNKYKDFSLKLTKEYTTEWQIEICND